MAERYTKTYVSVNVDIDEDGTMLPRLIRWMNGRVFAIEQERRDDDGREAEHDAEIEILRDEEQRHQRQPAQKNEPCVCPTGEENQIG